MALLDYFPPDSSRINGCTALAKKLGYCRKTISTKISDGTLNYFQIPNSNRKCFDMANLFAKHKHQSSRKLK